MIKKQYQHQGLSSSFTIHNTQSLTGVLKLSVVCAETEPGLYVLLCRSLQLVLIGVDNKRDA